MYCQLGHDQMLSYKDDMLYEGISITLRGKGMENGTSKGNEEWSFEVGDLEIDERMVGCVGMGLVQQM